MNSGINNEVLEKLIKVNNLNLESLHDNVNMLKKSIFSLDGCYSGNSIKFIFNSASKQTTNIDKINTVLNSYVAVLENVKLSYTKQDENIFNIMNRTNSQFK